MEENTAGAEKATSFDSWADPYPSPALDPVHTPSPSHAPDNPSPVPMIDLSPFPLAAGAMHTLSARDTCLLSTAADGIRPAHGHVYRSRGRRSHGRTVDGRVNSGDSSGGLVVVMAGVAWRMGFKALMGGWEEEESRKSELWTLRAVDRQFSAAERFVSYACISHSYRSHVFPPLVSIRAILWTAIRFKFTPSMRLLSHVLCFPVNHSRRRAW